MVYVLVYYANYFLSSPAWLVSTSKAMSCSFDPVLPGKEDPEAEPVLLSTQDRGRGQKW